MGKKNKGNKGLKPEVWIAIIGAFTTIIVALINSQTIVGWLLRPTPSPLAVSSPTPISTDTLIPVIQFPLTTSPPQATPTLTVTEISFTLPSATESPAAPIGMHVRLYADRTSGKAPLTVKFDARDSFLRAQGGKIYGCRSGACEYTWEVYSGGQRIGKSVHNSTGTFQYTFGKKGSYSITVWVCRGGGSTDCNGSGTQIIAS